MFKKIFSFILLFSLFCSTSMAEEISNIENISTEQKTKTTPENSELDNVIESINNDKNETILPQENEQNPTEAQKNEVIDIKKEEPKQKTIQDSTNDDFSGNVDISINSNVSEKIKIEILKTCLSQTINNQIAKEDGTIENTRQNNYFDITDKKQNSILSNIFIRLNNNLKITNLYNINNNQNNCEDITQFIKNNNSTIDDYIYSNFDNNAEFVVSSIINRTEKGEYKLEIYLWDTLDHKLIAGQYYILNKYNYKRISNVISDFIYTKTTGEDKGFFDSKILYISETGNAKNRIKNINIMNFNGENNIKITDEKLLTLTPIFSRYNRNEIYYLQYRNKKAYLYNENLLTHTKSILKIGDGIVFSPNFNPQEKNQIVLSMADYEGTNLFLLNNENNKYYRLTNDSFINTSPSFAPNGRSIAFVSDRTGVKKIYSMDLETGEINLISKNRGSYDKPVWAPDEKLIAFIKIEKGVFKLGIMTPDGENERYLLEDYLIEGLRWSPNSRYIMYSKQKGPFGKDSIPHLYVIDILTNYEYKLNIPDNEGASDPDWIMNE